MNYVLLVYILIVTALGVNTWLFIRGSDSGN